MSRRLSESDAELAALEWFEGLGYQVACGPDLAPGEPQAERTDFSQVVLTDRLRYFLPPAPTPACRRRSVRKPSARSSSPSSPTCCSTTTPSTTSS